MVARGVPMICMGDEYGHTKHGNNNTWCHDNEANWFLWDKLQENEGFFRFCCKVVEMRQSYQVLYRDKFVTHEDIEWFGSGDDPSNLDWSETSRFVAFMLKDERKQVYIYVAFNTSHQSVTIKLPMGSAERVWLRVIDTSFPCPYDFVEDVDTSPVTEEIIKMEPYSAILFKAAA